VKAIGDYVGSNSYLNVYLDFIQFNNSLRTTFTVGTFIIKVVLVASRYDSGSTLDEGISGASLSPILYFSIAHSALCLPLKFCINPKRILQQ